MKQIWDKKRNKMMYNGNIEKFIEPPVAPRGILQNWSRTIAKLHKIAISAISLILKPKVAFFIFYTSYNKKILWFNPKNIAKNAC